MPPRTIEGVDELRKLVGQEVGTSDWLTVTQDMIDSFSDVTRDKQWIHVDVPRAASESPFGTTIAHGFLTLSLLSHLHGQAVRVVGDQKMTINYGLNRVRFPNPVRVNSRIRAASGESGRRFSRWRADHLARDHRTGERREARPGR